MKIKKVRTVVMSLLVAFVAFFCNTSVAEAGIAYSEWATFTAAGSTYRAQSSIGTVGQNRINGSVTVATDVAKPAGYVGSYFGIASGISLVASKTSYTTYTTTTHTSRLSATGNAGEETYVSTPFAYIYDPSDGRYEDRALPQSPRQIVYSMTEQYFVDSSGKTYGSIVDVQDVGYFPDYIMAIATNGKNGYIKYSDLVSHNPSSPQEAVQLMQSSPKYDIPVYNLEGEQIGVHILEYAPDEL